MQSKKMNLYVKHALHFSVDLKNWKFWMIVHWKKHSTISLSYCVMAKETFLSVIIWWVLLHILNDDYLFRCQTGSQGDDDSFASLFIAK